MAEFKLAEIVMLLRRYGPLMRYFEDQTDGYGRYVVNMHGRVPRKVAREGKEFILEIIRPQDDIELDLTYEA